MRTLVFHKLTNEFNRFCFYKNTKIISNRIKFTKIETKNWHSWLIDFKTLPGIITVINDYNLDENWSAYLVLEE